MEHSSDLSMYIKSFRRRKWMFIIPAAVMMTICSMTALLLPAVYESTAVILIETQDIPEELVASTVTGLVEERLQGLSQVVLNRARLLDIMNRFELYESDRSTMSPTELVAMMRGDIHLDMIQTEIHDSKQARAGVATYAFSLSFEGRNPEKVVGVANELTSLYLEENIQSREEKARSAFNYLESRIQDLELQMNDVDERISAYKEQHRFALPELVPVHIRNLDRVEGEIHYIKDRLGAKKNRVRYWAGKKAATPQFIIVRTTGGQRLITPEEELDRMRRDYIALLANRSEDHPDAQNLKKEIDALEQQVKHRQDLKVYQDKLIEIENELAAAEEKHTDSHPDVKRLTKEVARTQEDIRTLEERYSILAKKQDKEVNPQWVHASNELDTETHDYEQLLGDMEQLNARREQLLSYIDQSPQVELEYNALLHERDSLSDEHDELLTRTLAAKEAKGLEESGLSEKFTLVDPPIRAEEPSKPNRPLLFSLGIIISLFAGAAVGTVAELLDRTLHDTDELLALTGLPVLAVIPYIETRAERATNKTQKMGSMAAIGGIIVLAVLCFHFFIMPLDILVYKIVDKIMGLF